MASNPRIDELRGRLAKEPQSRLFAQLAEELRKQGDLEEAIGVCRDGLQKHPLYPSARMTLGRALLDRGELEAARQEFESVLKGAPDNILASRFLGECLEGLGDISGARARYEATLTMAPGDRQLVARLDALAARGSAAAPTAVAAAEPTAVSAPEVEPPPIAVLPFDAPMELAAAYEGSAVDATLRGGEPWEESSPAAPAGGESRPIPVVQVDEDFELERPHEATRAPSAGLQPEAAPSAPAAAGFEDFDFEAPALTQPVPPGATAAAGEPSRATPPPSEPRLAQADATIVEAATAGEPGPAMPASTETPGIASQTLAELYFRQGFVERAVEVYRELLRREPTNAHALERLRELEQHAQATHRAGSATVGAAPDRREAMLRTIERLEGLLSALRRRQA